MGFCMKFTFLALAVIMGVGYQQYMSLSKHNPIPNLDLEEYWGPGKATKKDTTIKPFKISYSDETIKKLIEKINLSSKFPEPLENTNFEYGFNAKKLKQVINYWKDEYLPNWNKRQEYLNQFPQFKTTVQGLNIHYIHVKPVVKANTKVFPLILIHGWPGSVREFYDIIPMLTTPSKDNIAFEVIVPSLPGYGFSQGSSKKGLGAIKMGIIFKNLMERLGHDKFYVQGGDWGSLIGSSIATLFPDNVLGYHSNMCGIQTPLSGIKTFIASFYPSYFIEEARLASWIYPFSAKFMDLLQESGYMHIQATKPDTIGVALMNNPVGLAAYIIEKFSTWTNPDYRQLADGGLEKYFTHDSLLDNIMFYYLTDSITTSVRIYKETFISDMPLDIDRVPLIPPSACAHFKYELMHTPEFILKEKFMNLVHISVHEDGGHFAAMQLPKVMYDDILTFVKKTLK